MKVYLFISNHKKLLKMYLPYIEALNKQLDITNNLVDADIVLIIFHKYITHYFKNMGISI